MDDDDASMILKTIIVCGNNGNAELQEVFSSCSPFWSWVYNEMYYVWFMSVINTKMQFELLATSQM